MIQERLSEGTYIELVRSLFSTLVTTFIMAAAFAGTGAIVVTQTDDLVLVILTMLGSAAAFGRILVLIGRRRTAKEEALTYSRARQLERLFATSYLLFALIFGAFSARAFLIAAPETHVLVIGLLFGYGAGVAVNLSYRPWISVSAIIVAVVPTILIASSSSNMTYWWVALLLTMFLGGGIESMIARYRFASAEITMSRKFATLARIDALTELPNRLALSEQYSRIAVSGNAIAIHCLDLDKFKPVDVLP